MFFVKVYLMSTETEQDRDYLETTRHDIDNIELKQTGSDPNFQSIVEADSESTKQDLYKTYSSLQSLDNSQISETFESPILFSTPNETGNFFANHVCRVIYPWNYY